ncbi:MAG: hypothetical protein WA001_05005 [Patescibacteria group bacterium]
MEVNQKGIIVVLVAIIAVLLVGVGIFLFENKTVEIPSSQVQQTTSQPPVVAQQNLGNGPSSGMATYTNSQYGFSLDYPVETQVVTSTGNQIDISVDTPEGGRIVVFNPVATQGSLTIEAEPSANCMDTTSGAEPTHTTINGFDFTVYDLDRVLSPGFTAVTAREYCIIRGATEFKLITQMPYTGTPIQVDQDSILNQMLASFGLYLIPR